MNNIIMKKKNLTLKILQATFFVSISLFLFSGCSDTLDGDVNDNLKPIVNFVNIPPEGQLFSRNPEVFWSGTDPDGLIDYYRYYIAIKPEVDSAGGPIAFSASIADGDWVQIDIDQTESNPHSANVLPLTADTLDPVANPVGQYIFLQAFDRENLGSDIVFRLFKRNDNPPETQIFNIGNDTPFVNSVFEGGIVTGLRFQWKGFDRKDYDDIGLTPPPFDFEWKLFGPFEKDTINFINDNFIEEVFVTVDAKIIRLNEYFKTCNTVEVDTVINGVPTTIPIEVCDSVQFDSVFFADSLDTPFYSKKRILDIENPMISSHLVTSSFSGVDEWVQNTADTIFNVFRNGAPDTTVQLNFIFWLRSRDDAFVKDLTPEFVSFPVINPKYERDVAVIDFSIPGIFTFIYADPDTAKAFWHNVIKNWDSTRTENILFDTSVFTASEAGPAQAGRTGIDYIFTNRYTTGIPLNILLKHKVLILYNESIQGSGFVGKFNTNYPEILSAMDAGINVWAAWRNPLLSNFNELRIQEINAPLDDYKRYFGVDMISYSGWFANAFIANGDPVPTRLRNEDFIGTYSIDESQWPALDIDTSYLHSRLLWPTFLPAFIWVDSLAALPEVNWTARSFGTEVMYLYKSKYGSNHPLGGIQYEGSPVGHRFETNVYRTVHFNFTLLTMDSLQVQKIANNVLDWIYDPTLSGVSVKEDRYKDAIMKISIEDARQKYGERLVQRGLRRLESGN